MRQNTVKISIEQIVIEERIRKDIGYLKDGEEHTTSIEGLAESIKEVGLLQPIGITKENKLVFGFRRLIACRDILKWEKIPVRIVPVDSILHGQIHENSFRKDYTISERVAIVDALRSYRHGGDRKSNQALSGGFEKLTVKQACKLVGFGEDSYYRAKEVFDKGSTNLVKAVDNGTISITAAKFLVDEASYEEQSEVVLGKKKVTEAKAKAKLERIRKLEGFVAKNVDQEDDDRITNGDLKPVVPIIEPNGVYVGDCRNLIHELDDRSIDLCLTSPPYAEQRKNDYPSVPEEDYSEFTLEWMMALVPKLSPQGSVLINIDPHVEEGIVSDYVLKLQLALREAGWMQHPAQIWVKPNANPVGRPDWPKHAYEPILWFSLTEEPFCAAKRLRNHKGELTRVTDVIEVGVDNEPNVPHPARYPVRLAEQLIETFSPINGTVLDPFVGSGSTLAAAKKLRRNYIGFDLVPEYVELARERVNKQRVTLPVVHVDDDDEGIQAA